MTTTATPYADQALRYLDSGLGYPIPSYMPYEKGPPIKGWTGSNGAIPDRLQVEDWCASRPDSNILLRMAPNVIGIDVDSYDDKHGSETLKGLETIHGSLATTPTSTARQGASGIRWYRLRPWMDTDKMRDPGEHVEVVRYGHRYACAPPSWHQGVSASYYWRNGAMPTLDDLSWLPTQWFVHLVKGCNCFALERAAHKTHMSTLMNRSGGEAGAIAARLDLSHATEALRSTDVGNRNNMLSSIAGRVFLYDVVRNHVLDEEEVMMLLYETGIQSGLSAHETQRTIQSAMDWAIREGEEK